MNKSLARILYVVFGINLAISASVYAADPGKAFKEAWSCAKSLGEGSVKIGSDLIQKGESLASLPASAGKCLATSATDKAGFAITMGTLTAIKIASPSSIPNGQCLNSVTQSVAKPFGLGLAAVLPDSNAKTTLKNLLNSEVAASVLWQQMTKIPPPVATATGHVTCACEFIDRGVSLADLSAVSGAISQASDTCANFLDEAGLGFINDWGNTAITYTTDIYNYLGDVADDLRKKPKPAPDAQVYYGYWGIFVPSMAEIRALQPTADLGLADWGNKYNSWISLGDYCYQSGCKVNMALIYQQCVEYYTMHRFSPEHAKTKCNNHRAQASNEAEQKSKEYIAIRDLFALLPQEIDNQTTANWLWRLPNRSNSSGWSLWDAKQSVYLSILGAATKTKAFDEPWHYKTTGIYAAAREILSSVNYDPKKAAAMAVSAAFTAFHKKTYEQWDINRADARTHWMNKWFPQPAFAGPFGCKGNQVHSTECQKALKAAFDKVCLPAVVSAHTESPNVLAAGFRIPTAEKNCHSWLDPMINKINQVVDYQYQAHATVCNSFTPRTEEHQRCMNMVSSDFESCATSAIQNNQDTSNVKSCMEHAGKTILSRLGLLRRSTITPTEPLKPIRPLIK